MKEIGSKLRKRLENNLWYHGTLLSNWKSICENKVLVDFNKDTSDALDFGYGFYMAPDSAQAESFIRNLVANEVLMLKDDDKPIILGFEFEPLVYFESEVYKTKDFSKYKDDFASFVFENRTENKKGNKQHEYDIIYGVMSDSIPTESILGYKLGKKTKEEVLEDFKKSTSMKQISLHSQALCDILILKEAYILSFNNEERKELNVDDYNGQRCC